VRLSGATGDRTATDDVRHAALWFAPGPNGIQPLLDLIGDAHLVLIGAATHGTHEFHRIRADLTAALVRDKQFNVVAAEADWPDAHRLDRWVRQAGAEQGPEALLDDLVRFPCWTWRNDIVVDFIQWLRHYNARHAAVDRVGLHGLDLYSHHASMEAALTYLGKVNPAAASRVQRRYEYFEALGTGEQSDGHAATLGLSRSCEDDVVAQLMALQKATASGYFLAEQSARLVRDAEPYYRAMFGGHVNSWNLRETHMMETLDALIDWTARRAGYARAVVWAHNSHVGDARATQMADCGGLNLGRLARERHGDLVFLIGFTTHTGTVTAARAWDQPAELRQVVPSIAGSYEELFHQSGAERFILPIDQARQALTAPRLERAVGAIYTPETERASHYFRARMADQFDAVIHVDSTTALTPLERPSCCAAK
jgi:erythromycin esterase-like protein